MALPPRTAGGEAERAAAAWRRCGRARCRTGAGSAAVSARYRRGGREEAGRDAARGRARRRKTALLWGLRGPLPALAAPQVPYLRAPLRPAWDWEDPRPRWVASALPSLPAFCGAPGPWAAASNATGAAPFRLGVMPGAGRSRELSDVLEAYTTKVVFQQQSCS